MNKFLLIFSICLLSTTSLSAQDWIKLIEGTQSKSANQVLALPNGDYIIGGQVNDPGDLYLLSGLLVRIDPSGNVIWEKRIGSMAPDGAYDKNERFEDIALTTDGYIVAVGSRTPNQPNAYQLSDVMVRKIDLNGNVIWQQAYNWGGSDNATGVAALANGEIIVCGNTTSLSNGDYDGYLMKITAAGAIDWRTTYDAAASDDAFYDVLLTSDQQILTVGSAQLSSIGNEVFAVKTDLNGNELWKKTYTEYALKGNSVVEHKNGHFGICGQSYDWVGPTGFDNLMMEIDEAGTVIWDKRYHPSNTLAVPDELFNLIPCAEGGYAAVGMSGENAFDGYYVLRVDASGEPILATSFLDGAPYSEFATSLSWATDGGLIVTGGRIKPGGDYDLLMAHFSGFGCSQPTTSATIEAPAIGVIVSPNPSSDFILVDASRIAAEQYWFGIFDASGKLVSSTSAYQAQFSIDCRKFPAGTYFYKLQLEDGRIANGQLIVQR